MLDLRTVSDKVIKAWDGDGNEDLLGNSGRVDQDVEVAEPSDGVLDCGAHSTVSTDECRPGRRRRGSRGSTSKTVVDPDDLLPKERNPGGGESVLACDVWWVMNIRGYQRKQSGRRTH